MLYLDPTSSAVTKAHKEHVNAIRCRITKKLTGNRCVDKNCSICNSRKLTFKSSNEIKLKIIKFLIDDGNLDDLIGGTPVRLRELDDKFYEAVLPSAHQINVKNFFKLPMKKRKSTYKVLHRLFSDIGSLFDYDDWLNKRNPDDQYSLYDLAKNLDRRSCTYCNRTYTTTLTTEDNRKLMRPQFDHWFPKSKYPLLAVSFYNLIPSCYTCNSSAKRDVELNTDMHIHPYLDPDQIHDFSFSYINSKTYKYHIYLRSHNRDNKALSTLKKICIDRIYNSHIPELEDLIKIKKSYSQNYIKKLQKFFPKAGLTEKEVYRLVFGVEQDQEDFHKRPMSKFKYDILKELGIIK